MLNWMLQLLETAIQRVKELRIAFGIVGIAAAISIAAIILRGYLSSIAGVVVAVNMGVLLMIAILMFIAAAKAKGQTARPYQKLYFMIASVFSVILLISALLSLTSIFFHYPLNFDESSAIEQSFNGDYRIEETVILTDLRNRITTAGLAGVESKDPKVRIDRVVRQRTTDTPYEMQSGTNGLRIEQISSSTHPSMSTQEVTSARFALTTKHTYVHSIPSDRFPIGEPVTVRLDGVFVNAFSGEDEEWVGACPNIDTAVLTLVVLFPKGKPCKEAWAMEQPTGSSEIKFRGATAPVIHDGGSLVSWTLARPQKGIGYFIAFKW